MSDQDYIRKAVELADGFGVDPLDKDIIFGAGTATYLNEPHQYFLDALAAQLVRQVYSHCVRPIELAGPINYDLHDPMNTIKAIVDSSVLETAQNATSVPRSDQSIGK